MKTPIFDFVQKYGNSDFSRFHMPGHKGRDFTGSERFDITEIDGADVLYASDGIIKESEENASSLFCTAKTFYSTEGSSHAIRAMLGAVATHKKGTRALILAARNVHKAFIYACAALDIDVEWIYPKILLICAVVLLQKQMSSAQFPTAVNENPMPCISQHPTISVTLQTYRP